MIVRTIVSLMWWIHILIYVLPVTAQQTPLSPFLNTFFESTFSVPVFGIAFFTGTARISQLDFVLIVRICVLALALCVEGRVEGWN